MTAIKREFKEAISKITRTLKKEYHPAKIILFGSASREQVNENSDIDMLIIKDTSEPSRERWMTVGKLTRDLDRSIPFEPIILTPQELEIALESGDMFVGEIMKNGRILYDEAA